MGLLFGLALSWVLASGVYWLMRSSKARSDFWSEIKLRPLYSIFVNVWILFLMLFFWGVLVPRLGTIEVQLAGGRIELWQLGGIGALLGFVISLFVKDS